MSQRDAIQRAINQELQSADIPASVDMGQLEIPENLKVITENPNSPQTLSEAFIERSCPLISNPTILAHYTGPLAFKKIIDSSELRLHRLLDRVHETEFASFCEVHELKGHLQPVSGETEPHYKDLLRDLFYASFTPDHSVKESFAWSVFARSGTGVKLVFRAQTIDHRAELRPTFHSLGAKRPLPGVRSVAVRLLAEFDRSLILGGIGRLGAFFLPLGLGVEGEIRLLLNRCGDADVRDRVVGAGLDAYLPLPINRADEFCKLELIRIIPGPNSDRADLRDIISASPEFQHLAW